MASRLPETVFCVQPLQPDPEWPMPANFAYLSLDLETPQIYYEIRNSKSPQLSTLENSDTLQDEAS